VKIAALIVAAALAASVAWVAGELHRENCERADRVGCSVLPWDDGERAKLTDAQCARRDANGVDHSMLPGECQ